MVELDMCRVGVASSFISSAWPNYLAKYDQALLHTPALALWSDDISLLWRHVTGLSLQIVF